MAFQQSQSSSYIVTTTVFLLFLENCRFAVTLANVVFAVSLGFVILLTYLLVWSAGHVRHNGARWSMQHD